MPPAGERAGLLDESRETVASALGAQPDEIVFTSGGTESVALAIWGGVRAVRELGTRIVVSAVEHPAVGGVGHVLQSDGFEVVEIPVDTYGRIDLDRYAAEVRVPGTLLASVQHANHELGTMQQIGGGGSAGAGGEGAVPHRCLPDRGPASGRRRGARGRPALVLGAQVRRSARGRRALRASRGRRHRLSVRRRPRAQAPVGHGEHAGHRRDGGGAARLARLDGRHGGSAVGPHGPAARAHRRDRAGGDRARPPDPSHAAPRLLQRGRRRRADADDGPRRSRVPRGRRLALLGSARRRLAGARAHRTSGREQLPRGARAEQHRGRRRRDARRAAGLVRSSGRSRRARRTRSPASEPRRPVDERARAD